jgi:hypothetical protein
MFDYSMTKQEDRSKSELEVNSEMSNEGSELGEVMTRKQALLGPAALANLEREERTNEKLNQSTKIIDFNSKFKLDDEATLRDKRKKLKNARSQHVLGLSGLNE